MRLIAFAALLSPLLLAPPAHAQNAAIPRATDALPASVAPQLVELEKLSLQPANAKKAEALAERIRTPLFPYPAATQRMKLALARALAHQARLADADKHFRDAYAPNAPDAVTRFDAINTHVDFLADDPAFMEQCIKLTREALTAPTDSHQCHHAAYRYCCLLTMSGKYPEAQEAQRKLSSKPPADAALKEKVNRLGHYLKAIASRDAAIDPYFAPWRPIDSLGNLATRRRIADLAFAMRDIPKASKLYLELAKLARSSSQPEIEAWAHMQHSRTLYLSGKKEFAPAIAGLEKFRTTYAKAACAPYALLQCALLQNNLAKDRDKSRETLETILRDHRDSPEAEHASYYLVMLAYFGKDYGRASSLVRRHAELFPKSPKNAYLVSTFIPLMEKEAREAKDMKAK